MLLLHAIPEPVISDKKAFDVAKRILKLDPNNNVVMCLKTLQNVWTTLLSILMN